MNKKPGVSYKKNIRGNNAGRNIIIYGKHAGLAAINNSRRKILNVFITNNFDQLLLPEKMPLKPKIVAQQELEKLLSAGAVHQGIVVEALPLPEVGLDYINTKGGIVVILDQITDPQNIGAILRTATAFNVTAVIIPKDNAPEESSSLAKAASGALEFVPLIRVTNLVRAIEELKKNGYWCIGMDGDAVAVIDEIKDMGQNIALVMGAEGKGIRRLTRNMCDFIAKIPINNQMESLNVSNAAAIGLYCLSRNIGVDKNLCQE